ncbi:acyl-CoA thioesterase [Sphingomonas sp.]|uniref:acyl-CoA thioesterase n=1 Tax=Sphingomonas sp. TaxID=28214 RepID=UPI003CC54140
MSNSDWRREQRPIVIEDTDIDHMGHVNNAVYLRWVQETVIAHWARIAPPKEFARHLWIALKHEITYRRAAFAGDRLTAVAELEDFRGARSTYRTQVRRGDECLAEAFSHWCSIDAVTHRPLRLARNPRGRLNTQLL